MGPFVEPPRPKIWQGGWVDFFTSPKVYSYLRNHQGVFFNHPHTLEVSIGTKLKSLRLQAGLTQTQLANAAGILQGVLTRYETDKKVPSAPRLAAIARALGVTVEEILEESPPTSAQTAKPLLHGNSRAAKVQQLFLQLDEEAQRVILKQMKALIPTKPQSQTRPNQAA